MKKVIKPEDVKIGDVLYIPSSYHISRGEDDVKGGKATVEEIIKEKRLPEDHFNYWFVSFKENPKTSYNLRSLLSRQGELAKQFKNQKASPDPDITRPWIQSGDIVNGEVYKGPDII